MVRERLDAIYRGDLELPLPQFRDLTQHALHAFAATAQRYEIPRHYFAELIEELGAVRRIMRYATWSALEQHCSKTAGKVALSLAAVLGMTHSDASQWLIQLASAARLTVALRDLKQDWQRGRVVLPLEDLARFRYSERDLAASTVNENFRQLMRFEVERARELYRSGSNAICWLAGDGPRLAASGAVSLYSGILDEIERRDFDVFKTAPRLSRARKFRQLRLAWRLARSRADGQLPAGI